MKIQILFAFLFLTALPALYAQDDLLKDLQDADKSNTVYTMATFKTTRVVNGQSVEGLAAKHLDFRINHRFGPLNDGAYNFFGLDNAVNRLSLEYGINDNLMLGIGRSSAGKTFDGFVKWKLLRQSTGAKSSPVSISLFGNTAITTLDSKLLVPSGYSKYDFQNRLSYTAQVLIARKFNNAFSLQITPGVIHRNMVAKKIDQNDIFHIGIGGRIKLTRRTSFNMEYFYQLPKMFGPLKGYDDKTYSNSLSMGFDIETGGHVFQLHFTNSLGNIEQLFIADTQGKWSKGDVRFGFNISRTFSFADHAK
ncbi:MAG: DUF5777 family beta-barrel protein [Bacteroidota bacterium]